MATANVNQVLLQPGETAEGKSVPTKGTRTYRVTFDSPANVDTAAAMFADDGTTAIPSQGSAWNGTYTTLRLKSRRALRISKSTEVDVTLTYEVTDYTSAGSDSLAPLDRPMKVSVSGAPANVQVDTDANGDPIANKAGQVFPVTIDHSDERISIERNEASRTAYASYRNKVNSSTFRGYAAGRVRCIDVRQDYTEETFEGTNYQFWKVTYEFLVAMPRNDRDATTPKHTARIRNAGTWYLASGKRVPITDSNKTGQQINGMVDLDNSGAILDPASTPIWLTFDQYNSADFGALSLEDS